MPEYPYPCLQCGRATSSVDSYIVCDACWSDVDVDAGRRAEAAEGHRRKSVDGAPIPPLSPDEQRERLRHAVNDW